MMMRPLRTQLAPADSEGTDEAHGTLIESENQYGGVAASIVGSARTMGSATPPGGRRLRNRYP